MSHANTQPWAEIPVRPTCGPDRCSAHGFPFRLTWYMRSSQAGCYGWTHFHRFVATREEAIAYCNRPMGLAFKVEAHDCSPKHEGKQSWPFVYQRRHGQKK